MSISLLNDKASCVGVQAQPLLLSGLSSNLTWSVPDGNGISTASITIAGVLTTSIVSATLQEGTGADSLNCWITKATPTANTITFSCAGKPATPATFTISWQITNHLDG
jgi:hypothetical protein